MCMGNKTDHTLIWGWYVFQIPELKEIILIGFYQSSESLSKFIQNAQHEFNIPIRYITLTFHFEYTVIRFLIH